MARDKHPASGAPLFLCSQVRVTGRWTSYLRCRLSFTAEAVDAVSQILRTADVIGLHLDCTGCPLAPGLKVDVAGGWLAGL